jgi:hypothetical protein
MSDLFNLGDLVDRSADSGSIALIDLGAIGRPREYSHGDLDAAAQAVAWSRGGTNAVTILQFSHRIVRIF